MNYCQDGVQFYNAEEERLFINGHYELQPNYVNGRPYFKMDVFGLWWDGIDRWWIGVNRQGVGQQVGHTNFFEDVFCPHQLPGMKCSCIFNENKKII